MKQKQVVTSRKVLGNAPGSSRSPQNKECKDESKGVRIPRAKAELSGSDTGSESSASSEDEVEEIGDWWKAGKKGKRSQKVSYVCKGGDRRCGKAITGKERCIQCEACGDWYHPNCQGLCKGAFEALVKYDLLWICKECKVRLSDTLDLGKRLENRVAEAERRIIEKVTEVKTQTAADIEGKLDMGIKNMEEQVSKQINETSDALKKVVKVQEIERKVDRSCNVIIHNIPESSSEDVECRKEHDTSKVKDITNVLCGANVHCSVEKVLRLRKKVDAENENIVDRRPRLLLVKFQTKEDADMLYKSRFNLKDKGYPNTYITRDLSLEERERQKKLRQELVQKGKDSHKISGGKVVPKN